MLGCAVFFNPQSDNSAVAHLQNWSFVLDSECTDGIQLILWVRFQFE